MKFYFQIQYKRYYRKIAEMGIHPFLGMGIMLLALIFGTLFLFQKTIYANYIFGFIGLSIASGFNEKQRNEFLNLCFSKSKFYRIRLIENLLHISPFVLFLLYYQDFIMAISILILSLILVFVPLQNKWSVSLPSPFSRLPFEFTMGFRKLFLIYPMVYFLVYKSIGVGNFNLGIFAIGVLVITHMSYYFKPEHQYFVWIFAKNPKAFLWQKIKENLINSSLALLPILVLLSIYFPERYIILMGIFFMNALLMTTIILAKYSAYPKEINLPQMVLFGLSLWFPPILIIAIIYFYKQSLKNLNPILK
ncbi:ABC transporter permease [Lentimicrobium sp. L6]|uniref:ABC transporter permease n=1 Tax=Lentimicrobium sp. L6 TaxID=2735916 RepID=UPI0015520852|nr:ABC transporter permease [Lentimicrobium sp. L6]NPD86470.1 ABC transporter permease [Lentimicrobium sp. L6]